MLFKKNQLLFLLLMVQYCCLYAQQKTLHELSNKQVDILLSKANNNTFSSSEEAFNYANQALKIANQINYEKGKGRALRIIGVSYYNQNELDSASYYFFEAINISKSIRDRENEARVLNNIGYLYYTFDNTQALEYFNNALKLAKTFKIKDLEAGLFLNIGNVFLSKKNYLTALKNYQTSFKCFNLLSNTYGMITSLQNQGVIYYHLNQFDLAKKFLLEANDAAKKYAFNNSVASIDLTLVSIFLREKNFLLTEKYLDEGEAYAKLVNDVSKVDDYTFERFKLEKERSNYKKALEYLEKVHVRDSINFNQNITSNIKLSQKSNEQQQREIKNNLLLAQKKNDDIIRVASILFGVLCIFIIILLVRSMRNTKINTLKIMALNKEISEKNIKIESDNQKLEDLIMDRTRDLVKKNQKLSQYSSHLSHQIRGPIATLKGLVLLTEDNLIEEIELMPSIKKCVNEIDHQIMTINDALHDPTKYSLDD